MIPVSPEDSQAGARPASLGLDGAPLEVPRGSAATETGLLPPVFRGPVPGGVAPGTTAPLSDTPLEESGAVTSPAPGARGGSNAPGAGSTTRANGSHAPRLYEYGASRKAGRPETEAITARGVNRHFYVNVRAELKARGWSARELARRAGKPPNFLTKVRLGHWIALESAAVVADVLGVPLGDLIAENGAERQKPRGAA